MFLGVHNLCNTWALVAVMSGILAGCFAFLFRGVALRRDCNY